MDFFKSNEFMNYLLTLSYFSEPRNSFQSADVTWNKFQFDVVISSNLHWDTRDKILELFNPQLVSENITQS